MTEYLINFVNHLNPNGIGQPGTPWPRYTTSSPQLMTFQDDVFQPLYISLDTYREEAISFLTNLSLANPI